MDRQDDWLLRYQRRQCWIEWTKSVGAGVGQFILLALLLLVVLPILAIPAGLFIACQETLRVLEKLSRAGVDGMEKLDDWLDEKCWRYFKKRKP